MARKRIKLSGPLMDLPTPVGGVGSELTRQLVNAMVFPTYEDAANEALMRSDFVFQPLQIRGGWVLHIVESHGGTAFLAKATPIRNPGVPHGTFAKLRRYAVRQGATDPDAYAASIERKMMHRNPMLHKVEALAPNQTEVSHGDVVAFVSYNTPVAIVTRGPGGHYDAFVTEKKWSNTTTRHLNKWLRSRGIEQATRKPQKWIEEALEQGTFHNPPLAILGNPRGDFRYADASYRAPRYTQKAVRDWAKLLGCTARYNAETGEWRVNFRGGSEATAYYTPDAQDAISTMRAMVQRRGL